jgi:hypothetical protein
VRCIQDGVNITRADRHGGLEQLGTIALLPAASVALLLRTDRHRTYRHRELILEMMGSFWSPGNYV